MSQDSLFQCFMASCTAAHAMDAELRHDICQYT